MLYQTVYFDESYTHPPAPLVYSVGGYVSSYMQWKQFQKEWKLALAQAGVEYFHMVEFQACKPPYDVWSKQKRVRFLQTLHKIIHKRVQRSFASTVIMEDYNRLTEEQKRAFGTPHAYAAVNCMKHIANWCNENNYNAPMAYVFEKGSAHDKEIRKLFEEILGAGEREFYRVGSFSFADKKDVLPLQASDILAYEVTKETSRQRDQGTTRLTRKSIKNLHVSRLDMWVYSTAEHFSEAWRIMLDQGLIPPLKFDERKIE
jgi:hypothetical protein